MDDVMVVLSNAVPDLEGDFNDWYSNVHIVEVVDQLDGFDAAQRFVLAADQVEGGAPYKYLALYRIKEGRLDDARAAIRHQRAERAEAIAAGRAPMISNRSGLFDGQHHTWFFSAISPEYRAAEEIDSDAGH